MRLAGSRAIVGRWPRIERFWLSWWPRYLAAKKVVAWRPLLASRPYHAEGHVIAEWDSCDLHGGPAIKEFAYAEALRSAAQFLQANGAHWWDGDELHPPAKKGGD